MFTGLVEAMGQVVVVRDTPTGRRLEIDPGVWGHQPALGASIAVSGCCLTVVETVGGRFAFDVVHRTLEVTTLGDLVQGHVDAVGTIREIDEGDDWRVRIAAPPEVASHLVDRGSITVDGVSLTVARVLRDADGRVDGFEVALIPETLARTTLADLRVDDRVNLEADAMSKMIASHVERLLTARDLDRGG
jgi:riboflavin synthase